MPKDTFFNLPPDKRAKILEVAIDAFSQEHFEKVSVNQIVANSGISKGSFYQYFEDKTDLYKHIIQRIIEKKMDYITPVMANPFEHKFIDVVRDMNLSGIRFAKENPKFTAIGNFLLKDIKKPFYKEIINQNQGQAHDVYAMLLKHAIARGEVREDIDVDFTARIIFKMSSEVILEEIDLNSEKWMDNVIELLDKFMTLIENAIAKK